MKAIKIISQTENGTNAMKQSLKEITLVQRVMLKSAGGKMPEVVNTTPYTQLVTVPEKVRHVIYPDDFKNIIIRGLKEFGAENMTDYKLEEVR